MPKDPPARQNGAYRRVESKEDVIERIRYMAKLGSSLKRAEVRDLHPELFAAARRRFGWWRNAILASGVDGDKVWHYRHWTATRVLQTIQKYTLQGIPLNYRSVHQVDKGILDGAKRLFGSWDAALREAGYDPASIRLLRRPWTRESVVDLIRTRAKTKLPLGSSFVSDSVRKASYRLFGSWTVAVRSAGVPYRPVRLPKWTEVSVVEAILDRQLANRPLNAGAVAKHRASLYCGARRCFGNWAAALRAAGVDPAAVRKRHGFWTHEEVIKELRRCSHQVRDPRSSSWYPPPLMQAALRRFGSWQKALRAAGIQ